VLLLQLLLEKVQLMHWAGSCLAARATLPLLLLA
jgi:hypothetical protein